jgi:predicted cobalt transporter CbtA
VHDSGLCAVSGAAQSAMLEACLPSPYMYGADVYTSAPDAEHEQVYAHTPAHAARQCSDPEANSAISRDVYLQRTCADCLENVDAYGRSSVQLAGRFSGSTHTS